MSERPESFFREPVPDNRKESLEKCAQEDCGSELVYPVDWRDFSAEQDNSNDELEITCVCPNCGWQGTSVRDGDTIHEFDVTQDRGVEAVVAALRVLTRINMEDGVERFVRALMDDFVLPEDF